MAGDRAKFDDDGNPGPRAERLSQEIPESAGVRSIMVDRTRWGVEFSC